jgi:hypothetical protein
MISVDFYCALFIQGRPQADSWIHVIVSDGCKVLLDKDTPNMTLAQQRAISDAFYDRAKKKLLYLNSSIVEELFKDGRLMVHCPTCNQDYHILESEYEKAKQEFLEMRL